MRRSTSRVSTGPRGLPIGLRFARAILRGLALVSVDLAARAAFRLWFRPTRSPASPAADRVLREGRWRWVSFGTRRVACWEWGEGPGVLLLHGWNSRAAHLTSYVGPLVASGFRVVAIDAPAHGRSPGRRTDVWEIVEALAEVERKLGPFRGVVTHSFGSTLLAAALSEGRFSVHRVVCLAAATSRASLLSAFAGSLDLPEVVLAGVARRLDAFTGPDFWDRLEIRVPTLLVHDAGDERIPLSDAKQLEQDWPEARLVVTHGLRHRGLLSDPSVVQQAVTFLQEAPPD